MVETSRTRIECGVESGMGIELWQSYAISYIIIATLKINKNNSKVKSNNCHKKSFPFTNEL